MGRMLLSTRAQGTSTPVVATEAVPQRVYRPRNKVSNPKLRSTSEKKQATKQALQSASSRSNTSKRNVC